MYDIICQLRRYAKIVFYIYVFDFILKICKLMCLNMNSRTSILYIGFYIFLKRGGMYFYVESVILACMKHRSHQNV